MLSLISIQVFSQQSFGIKGGYTEAWEDYGDVFLPPNADTHISGFHISALGYTSVNNWFSIGIEPGYVKRGAACVPGFTTPVFDTQFNLNYIELPVMAKGSIPLFKNKMEIFGKLGYGVSYLAAAYEVQEDLFGDLPDVKMKMSLDETGILHRWDHGIYSAAGFGYNFSASQLFTSFDFYYGMMDAEKNNTSKNRSFNISVGYTYFLSRLVGIE